MDTDSNLHQTLALSSIAPSGSSPSYEPQPPEDINQAVTRPSQSPRPASTPTHVEHTTRGHGSQPQDVPVAARTRGKHLLLSLTSEDDGTETRASVRARSPSPSRTAVCKKRRREALSPAPLPDREPIRNADIPPTTAQEKLDRLISAPQIGRAGRTYVEFHSNFNQAVESPDDPITIISILRSSNLEERPDQWFDHVAWKKTRRALNEIVEWKKGAKDWREASRSGTMPWFPQSKEIQSLRYLDPTTPGFNDRILKLAMEAELSYMFLGHPPSPFWAGAHLDDLTWRRGHMKEPARSLAVRLPADLEESLSGLEQLMRCAFRERFPRVDESTSPDSLRRAGRRYRRPLFHAAAVPQAEDLSELLPSFDDGARTPDFNNPSLPSSPASSVSSEQIFTPGAQHMERLTNPDADFVEAFRARHSLAAIYKRRRTMDEEGMRKADDMLFSRLHRKQEENEARIATAETQIAGLGARVEAGSTGLADLEARMNDRIVVLRRDLEDKGRDNPGGGVLAMVQATVKAEMAAYAMELSRLSARVKDLEDARVQRPIQVSYTPAGDKPAGVEAIHIHLTGPALTHVDQD